MNGEDAFVTLLEGLGQLLEAMAVFGPWVLAVGGLLFLIVFSLALTFIISTWRSINRDHAEMRARMRSGRGLRG